MKFETKAIHSGQAPDISTGSIIVPIYQTSTYTYLGFGKPGPYEYSRERNPTRTALEECIASLENCKYGLAFASGMAGIHAVINLLNSGRSNSPLHQGDHVISTCDVYGGTYRIFEQFLKEKGYEFTFVDTRNINNVVSAIKRNTRMLWLESPTNPLLRLVDLKEAVRIGKKHKLITVVDNTFATPYFQKPADFGIDIVVHSATKYLGGHSDVILGVVTTNNKEYYEKLKFYQNTCGAIPGPFDSWLTLRGLKTLAVRMKQHFENALKVALFLESHKSVERVYYPWLASHPQQGLAKKQMSGMSGIVSFEMKGNVKEFLEKLKVFTFGASLGGVESLAEHPQTMSHAEIPLDEQLKFGIKDNLIRLSVGIENIDDLIADLEEALKE